MNTRLDNAEGMSRQSDEAEVSFVDVGERLRAIRLRKRMTLKRLADASRLSESFLSQLERGRVNASIASLQRIAHALGTSIAELFDPVPDGAVRLLRKAERPSLGFGVLGRKFLLTPTPLENLEVIVGAFEPGGSTGEEPYTHPDSDELFVVLSGAFELQVGDERFSLLEGDCVAYRSSMPHKATNVGDSRGEVMWIMSPPSY